MALDAVRRARFRQKAQEPGRQSRRSSALASALSALAEASRLEGGIMMRFLGVRHFYRCALLLLAGLALGGSVARADDDDPRWVGTWSASMEAPFGPAVTF